MTDKELIKFVTSFRKGVLGNRRPLKMCFAVCSPLSTLLRLSGVKNELTEGEGRLTGHNKGVVIGHFWITLSDGRIIDPTISQFNGWGREDMPHVYFGKKPTWLRKIKQPTE
jgi:hypothetical protein